MTQASQQSDAERKVQRKIFAAAIKISDDLDRVLEKETMARVAFKDKCVWIGV